jgi:hypothetical protein
MILDSSKLYDLMLIVDFRHHGLVTCFFPATSTIYARIGISDAEGNCLLIEKIATTKQLSIVL